MKKNQSMLVKLARSVSPIQENQYGILSGGYSTVRGSSSGAANTPVAAPGANTNNAVGCTCSNTNKSCLC